MPDPTWTDDYNFGNTPESNGFTRTLTGSPVVTEVTSGNPANRRVEINSDNGDAVFLTASVPSLDDLVGATGEFEAQCTGGGDVGFEITMLGTVILVNVFETFVELYCPAGDDPVAQPTISLEYSGQDNTVTTKWRVTIGPEPDQECHLYRDEVELTPVGGINLNDVTKSFQRVLWWGEGGGTQVLRGMRYYQGGPVVPG